MFKLVTGLLCLTFASSVLGRHICNAPKELSTSNEIRGLASVVGEIGSELNGDTNFAMKMCSHSYSAWTNNDPVKRFEDAILNEIGADINDPKRIEKVSNFLNERSKELICTTNSVNRIRDHEQILKRSVARGEYMYLQHLSRNIEYEIDFNAYEIVDGKKETIVDYIEMIINDEELAEDFNVNELRVLVRELEERGATRGINL